MDWGTELWVSPPSTRSCQCGAAAFRGPRARTNVKVGIKCARCASAGMVPFSDSSLGHRGVPTKSGLTQCRLSTRRPGSVHLILDQRSLALLRSLCGEVGKVRLKVIMCLKMLFTFLATCLYHQAKWLEMVLDSALTR